VLKGIDLAQRSEEERISILVEVGKLSPSVVLFQLDEPADVSLEISKGEAEFLFTSDKKAAPERTKRVKYRSREVVLPPLFAGEAEFAESLLIISVGSVDIGEPIRVATLAAGHIEVLWLGTRTLRPAVLWYERMGRAVIVDPRSIVAEELQNDLEELSSEAAAVGDISDNRPGTLSEWQNQVAQIQEEGGYRCPVLVWYRPRETDSPFRPNTCLLNTKLSGSVEFIESSPTQGWSIKPESGGPGSLFRPTQSIVNLVDGLYRSSWGCGIALKIPNNVVARVFAVDASCCQGLLAAAFGVTCTWVNPLTPPESPTWPVCPLP
jgi:hypothetical protein